MGSNSRKNHINSFLEQKNKQEIILDETDASELSSFALHVVKRGLSLLETELYIMPKNAEDVKYCVALYSLVHNRAAPREIIQTIYSKLGNAKDTLASIINEHPITHITPIDDRFEDEITLELIKSLVQTDASIAHSSDYKDIKNISSLGMMISHEVALYEQSTNNKIKKRSAIEDTLNTIKKKKETKKKKTIDDIFTRTKTTQSKTTRKNNLAIDNIISRKKEDPIQEIKGYIATGTADTLLEADKKIESIKDKYTKEELLPLNKAIQKNLASIYFSKNQFREAISPLEKYVGLAQEDNSFSTINDKEIIFDLITSYNIIGRVDQALRHFDKLEWSKDKEFICSFAQSYIEIQEDIPDPKYIENLKTLSPHIQDDIAIRGEIQKEISKKYIKEGKLLEAEEYSKTLDDPDEKLYLKALISSYKDPKQAKSIYKDAIQEIKKPIYNSALLYELAEVTLQEGENKEAHDALQESIRFYPDQRAYELLGILLSEHFLDFSGACDIYEQAKIYFPDSKRLLTKQIYVAQKIGNNEIVNKNNKKIEELD